MSYTMTMEPEIEREATAYASLRGITMEQLLRYCLEKVLREDLRKRALIKNKLAKLDSMVENSRGRLSEPYVFNRVDAYPEGKFA